MWTRVDAQLNPPTVAQTLSACKKARNAKKWRRQGLTVLVFAKLEDCLSAIAGRGGQGSNFDTAAAILAVIGLSETRPVGR